MPLSLSLSLVNYNRWPALLPFPTALTISSSQRAARHKAERQAMTALRKYPHLPVHIVEEHNDALHPILRAVGSKHLPFSNNLLLHFDSHPDLLIPTDLKASEVFDVPNMLEKLSIENWILAAAFTGQISTIIWMKPSWSNQIEDGHYNFLIGEQKGTDRIRVSCPAFYFVGEMLYCKPEELTSTKEVNLHVHTLGTEVEETVEQDLVRLINCHENHYVLDVDLDYFSTRNPFVSMHSKADMYERLKTLYHFKYTQTEETEVVEEHVKRRSAQIETLHSIFSYLQKLKDPTEIEAEITSVCQPMQDSKQREYLKALILDLLKDCQGEDGESGVDWELVHDAGCTIDDDTHQLPHHVSSKEEIDSLMETFCSLVTRLPQPTLVTVARSSEDDYCPPHQVDGIQEALCGFLRKTYSINCLKHYQD
ncbi:UPF0489 protein C5orf22 homolog isoform X1 [Scylla paramamosain]|uniref:UPF0489 protein C5orf22 homolog isoform X1 n=2 Tax=Scylla paramamosain TaxID=85552 RepID=UPI003083E3E3